VTGRTADAFIHVNRVIEICVVRQVVHANPFQRLARLETGAHRLEIRTVRPDLFVAAHANISRRNAGRRRRFHARVAVTAIDAVVAHVMLMAELNWLLAFDVRAGVPARTIYADANEHRGDQKENGAKDRGSRQIVCAVSEYLRHRRRINRNPFRRRTCPPSFLAAGQDPPLNVLHENCELYCLWLAYFNEKPNIFQTIG
jgi:hypothetical protein